MPVETPDEASQIIKKWMEDRGFFTAEKTDEKTHFLFEGNCGNGLNFAIQQPKAIKRIVGVTQRMLFDPQHLSALDSLPSEKRDEFVWNLRKDLIFAPPTVSFEPDAVNPESVFIVKEISYDELTEGQLNAAVDQVTRVLVWVSSSFIRKFGEPKEE
jgi:hypothetical protein